jgi:hypothetical protein
MKGVGAQLLIHCAAYIFQPTIQSSKSAQDFQYVARATIKKEPRVSSKKRDGGSRQKATDRLGKVSGRAGSQPP